MAALHVTDGLDSQKGVVYPPYRIPRECATEVGVGAIDCQVALQFKAAACPDCSWSISIK
jgi:hypothetical protein